MTTAGNTNPSANNNGDHFSQFSDANINCESFRKIFEYMKSLQSVYPAAQYIDVHLEDVIVVSRLFNKVSPENAANQLLAFAYDVLTFCKTLKSNEDSDLVVKAGMISDGPVTAGIIYYHDVPHFEVISVFIDYAKSMARFAPDFSIHIHISTFEYVFNSGYEIKELESMNIPSLGSIVTKVIYV